AAEHRKAAKATAAARARAQGETVLGCETARADAARKSTVMGAIRNRQLRRRWRAESAGVNRVRGWTRSSDQANAVRRSDVATLTSRGMVGGRPPPASQKRRCSAFSLRLAGRRGA